MNIIQNIAIINQSCVPKKKIHNKTGSIEKPRNYGMTIQLPTYFRYLTGIPVRWIPIDTTNRHHLNHKTYDTKKSNYCILHSPKYLNLATSVSRTALSVVHWARSPQQTGSCRKYAAAQPKWLVAGHAGQCKVGIALSITTKLSPGAWHTGRQRQECTHVFR